MLGLRVHGQNIDHRDRASKFAGVGLRDLVAKFKGLGWLGRFATADNYGLKFPSAI